MDPRVKRLLITLIVLTAAIAIIAVVFSARPPKPTAPPAGSTANSAAENATDTPEEPADSIRGTGDDAPTEPEVQPTAQDTAAVADDDAAPSSDFDLTTLIARAPNARDASTPDLDTIGSLDPAKHEFQVALTSRGASINRITFANIWTHVQFRQQARAHREAIAKGDPNPPPMPPDDERLVLTEVQGINHIGLTGDPQPVLAMHSIVVNGTSVDLFDYRTEADGSRAAVWSNTGPGRFESEIVDGHGTPTLRVVRQWTLGENSYDLQLKQFVQNLTGQQLTVQWRQFGPPQLEPTGAPYIDPRRFRFGYLLSKQVDPQRLAEVNPGTGMMLDIASAKSRIKEAGQIAGTTPAELQERNDLLTQWPNAEARREGYELSWFASTNRYFALAIHPPYDGTGQVERSLTRSVSEIKQALYVSPTAADREYVSTFVISPPHTLAPGGTADFSLGVYAGPMDRKILNDAQPYSALNLGGLIVYQMSSFCAFCTFQWLAHLLIWFLAAAHAVVFDWGVAIILLVLCVRLILHPLVKRSQVSMHRTMKAMAKFKPEMEKLQKKYANDKKKLQSAQIELMREHGVNPLGCLGILPMLLQMPIWIALYAMLFFAYELRQEPAFWGFFQMFGNWGFLADLSQADHFLGEFSSPVYPLGFLGIEFFSITGINILPVIMGVVFFLQQKYMTPPTTGTMSKEQQQQQKIMRFMMIFLFPIMLYNAPSGLTLYIMTSSTVGIIESKRIRKHAEELDKLREANPNERMSSPPWGDKDKKRKPRDPRGRAYADMLERMRKNKQEQRSFKKRRKDQ